MLELSKFEGTISLLGKPRAVVFQSGGLLLASLSPMEALAVLRTLEVLVLPGEATAKPSPAAPPGNGAAAPSNGEAAPTSGMAPSASREEHPDPRQAGLPFDAVLIASSKVPEAAVDAAVKTKLAEKGSPPTPAEIKAVVAAQPPGVLIPKATAESAASPQTEHKLQLATADHGVTTEELIDQITTDLGTGDGGVSLDAALRAAGPASASLSDRVVAVLVTQPGLRLGKIAEALGVKSSDLEALMGQLREDGLVHLRGQRKGAVYHPGPFVPPPATAAELASTEMVIEPPALPAASTAPSPLAADGQPVVMTTPADAGPASIPAKAAEPKPESTPVAATTVEAAPAETPSDKGSNGARQKEPIPQEIQEEKTLVPVLRWMLSRGVAREKLEHACRTVREKIYVLGRIREADLPTRIKSSLVVIDDLDGAT